jgi:serine/threonine protein kinase
MGIIHRDVKPSNLLVDAHAHLWVTDFGLARIGASAELTVSGDVVGTLRYMSPEQAAGQTATLDQRTDIYSLGATLYELLTLRPAFPAHDRQTLLHRILHDEPVPPRKLNASLPVDLQTIIHKAMSKSPGDRYATAQALADDLRRFLDYRPIQARPLGRIARTWRWCRRSPAFASSLIAALVLLVCVSLVSVSFALRESTHRRQSDAAAEKARWQQYISDMRPARTTFAGLSGITCCTSVNWRVRNSIFLILRVCGRSLSQRTTS